MSGPSGRTAPGNDRWRWREVSRVDKRPNSDKAATMKLSSVCLSVVALGLLLVSVLEAPCLRAAPQSSGLSQFIYLVHLAPRLHEEKGWTPQDREVAMRHFERLKVAGAHGPVIMAGRTEESADKTFEIVIFEAPDAIAARAFMESDPGVKAGIMIAELHPYLVAVERNAIHPPVGPGTTER